jgi:hypothetical protein
MRAWPASVLKIVMTCVRACSAHSRLQAGNMGALAEPFRQMSLYLNVVAGATSFSRLWMSVTFIWSHRSVILLSLASRDKQDPSDCAVRVCIIADSIADLVSAIRHRTVL